LRCSIAIVRQAIFCRDLDFQFTPHLLVTLVYYLANKGDTWQLRDYLAAAIIQNTVLYAAIVTDLRALGLTSTTPAKIAHYVIHFSLSCTGAAGFTLKYWSPPRIKVNIETPQPLSFGLASGGRHGLAEYWLI